MSTKSRETAFGGRITCIRQLNRREGAARNAGAALATGHYFAFLDSDDYWLPDKLAGQATGQFYLVRESSVTPVRSDESFLRTEQMPEDQIANLAHQVSG